MKRVWIVCFIVVGILGLSIVAIFHLTKVTDEMEASLVRLTSAIEAEDAELVQSLAEAFHKEWEGNEVEMIRYIHHDELDSITGYVARLPALAKHEDYTELSAEIARLKHLLRHIQESELPTLSNIL